MTFSHRLLAWFDRNRRDLPWRRTRDPWAIWVSEIMLQQTRVEAVRESYRNFLRAFPTPGAFARASDDELMLAWRGLGYYRRAHLLRDAARVVDEVHGGAVPGTAEELSRLPGVGRYTKGAIASIAFGEATPAIDGNVERVAARHRGIDTDVKQAPAQRQVEAAVRSWFDPARAGDFNQALMELGAVVCTPRSPRCPDCPVAVECVAKREGASERYPVRKAPRAPVDVTARVALVQGKQGMLGARVPSGEPNAGQVELPGAGILTSVEHDDLEAALHERYEARIVVGQELATVKHAITHHRIRLIAHAAIVRAPGRLSWFAVEEDVPWVTAARKMFRACAGMHA